MTLITTVSVQPFALFDGDLATSAAVQVGAANTAYLVAVPLRVPATLTGIRVKFGTGGAGHYDVGIYTDNNGVPNALLDHAAATATSLVTASNTLTPTFLGGNLTIQAGRYWLALWIDNATDTITRVIGGNGLTIVKSGTNAGPLPALASSLTGLANATFKPMIAGILLNGWS